MSSRENLSDNISDKHEFTIGGLDFDLKYPTMTDLEPIDNLFKELKTADEDRKKVINEEITDKMYAMITPVGHDTPIKEVLKNQPLPVVKAFNRMLKREFEAE